jgi:hypothetical protein
MDHEIEHDAAVVDPAGERSEPVDLKETDILCDLFDTLKARIVPFDMPDLEG